MPKTALSAAQERKGTHLPQPTFETMLMNSLFFTPAGGVRLRSRQIPSAALRAGRIGIMAIAVTFALPLFGQTFVAEWAESDVGRLGPTGLAVDRIEGTTYLYASDQILGRIFKFNLTAGRREAVLGGSGFGDGEFNSPYGLAVDPVSHDIYVAERANNRIQRITRDGTPVLKWGTRGEGSVEGEFNGPFGIAADAEGNVYVTDQGNNRIQKFHVSRNQAGWEVRQVWSKGRKGTGAGEFNGPFGITLDPSGNLWVAEGYNHRLQRFTRDGEFLGAIGVFGRGAGEFVTPTGVTFDATGNYYVTETNSDPANKAAEDLGHQRIQKFDAGGRFLLQWGSLGEAGGQFRLPLQLALDGLGNAYVSDYYNTRLQKFALAGEQVVTPPPVGAGAPRFVNLSSRLATAEGNAERAFIAGFVVSGSAPKRMLIRAVGPGLAQFGVTATLTNPRLRIFSGDRLIAENEDWIDEAGLRAATTAVGGFALPAGSRDSALLVTLVPGAYSAHVLAGGGEGVALVEVYDAESAQISTQLVNLSTRGYVGTGDDVLVAGFVVSGDAPKRVLVRGIGPTLVGFGVTGSLPDPVLKVYRGTSVVAENDDWENSQPAAATTGAEMAAAASSAGAFALPSGSKDAALILTLAPGAYSAVISGANSSSGAGMVEVYELTR